MRNRHQWFVLNLSPEDVDDLMDTAENFNNAMSTDQIEQLSVFYTNRIKQRSLEQLLHEMDGVVSKAVPKRSMPDTEAEILTPKRSTNSGANFDIAEENYLLAAKKLQLNSNSSSLKMLTNSQH